MTAKPRVAVHKFSSCDGCQLAFLNLGPALLDVCGALDIVHFAEAGPVDEDAEVDIAFVEGSVTTPHDVERIARVRERSKYLVTIGACATAGGIQALRNAADGAAMIAGVYARPEWVKALPTSTPISRHVKVDFELWGCPINGRQVVAAVNALLLGVSPADPAEKVCMACKQRQAVCVMVAHGTPCMGPVTRTGCGALCPSFCRDCYACYGPAEGVNTRAMTRRLEGLGLLPEQVGHRFRFINAEAPAFREAATTAEEQGR